MNTTCAPLRILATVLFILATATATLAAPVFAAASAFPVSETFKLHSLPGAKLTILLDFGPRMISECWITSHKHLRAVEAVGSGGVWAAGDDLVMRYDGSTWTKQPRRTALKDISMVSPSDGWAVGNLGVILRYAAGKWTESQSPLGATLYGVSMGGPSDGWAVGEAGTIAHYTSGSWKLAPSPTSQRLSDVHMISPSEGWAVGDGGTILHFSGGTWASQASPTVENLHGVRMLSPTDGWAVGERSTLLRYSGGSWIPQPHPMTSALVSVWPVSATDVWAVGTGGAILHFDGLAWNTQPSPTQQQLDEVEMVSASDGWVVGMDDTVLRYQGGAWVAQQLPAGANSPAWSLDADPSFSDAEKSVIQEIWQRVAEDYAPFAVDVTTEYTGEDAITRSTAADMVYGMRILFSPLDDGGGVAAPGGASFDDVGDFNKPAFVFQGPQYTTKDLAETATHECGHTFGLRHDSAPGVEYYQGQGSGPTGWAPIMGESHYRELTQWSKGEYPGATNQEDDLAILAALLGYRADDHGDTNAAATPLPAPFTGAVSGTIASSTDVDVFRLESTGGPFAANVLPASVSPNLDILAELRDATGALITSGNPPDLLSAGVSATLSAGTYYLSIRGTGKGSPADVGGYSSYGSIGQYTLSLPTGDLSGSVTFAGRPLAGAVVTVSGRSVKTDARGQFRITGVVPSSAAIAVSKPGYDTRRLSASVAAGQTTTVTVALTVTPRLSWSPPVSTRIYQRRGGRARFSLSAITKGADGALVPRVKVYLQTSKNGVTGWKDGGVALLSGATGRVSRAITATKSSTTYYRWRIPSQAGVKRTAVTAKQKIVIR